MKIVLRIALLAVLAWGSINAQLIFEENFNYSAGALLTANGYLVSSGGGTNALTVSSPGLTFPKYPSVAGNALTLTTSGEDDYKSYTPITSGTVYLSFLMNVQSAQATGDYFIALSPSTSQTFYTCRTFVKSNGAGYSMGITKSNEIATNNYGNTIYNFGTTYMVVVKYVFNTGSNTDDAISLYVLTAAAPTVEPTTAEFGPYVCSDATKVDQVDLGYITYRQGSASNAPSLMMDGIRIAKSWTTVTDISNDANQIPGEFQLYQNYPNPFNPTTNISYTLPKQSDVQITIHDITGSDVKTYSLNSQSTGIHTIQWDGTNNSGSDVTSGVYIYSVKVKSVDDGKVFQKSAKLTLIR